MTFRRQVWHLVRRDLVRAAPWLALTAAVLVIATARAIESSLIPATTLPTHSVFLLCVSVISALIVVADSPVRTDAFWATQPIDARAIAIAKCIGALVPVIMCAGAVCFVLHEWGYSVGTASDLLAVTVSTLAIWAFGVAVVAAICARRTVAWFAVGSAATVGLLFGQAAVPSAEVGGAGWGLGTLASVAAGTLTLAWLYRRRPTEPWKRSAALLVGVLLVTLSALNVSVASSSAAATTPIHAPSVALRVPLTAQPECDARWLVIPLEVSSSPWAKVDLTTPTVRITLDSGDSLSLQSPEWMQSAGLWGPLVSPARIGRLVNDEPLVGARRVRRVDIAFDIPAGQQHRICGHVQRVALELYVRTAVGEERMRLPLVAGAVASAPGLRARVVDVGHRNIPQKITVGLSSLGGRSGEKDADVTGLDFALVAREGGAVFRLNNRSTDGWMRTADLPGLSRTSGFQQLALEGRAKLDNWSTPRANTLQVVVTAPVWGARAARTVSAVVLSPVTALPTRTDGGEHR
jgi:hypothetical protein